MATLGSLMIRMGVIDAWSTPMREMEGAVNRLGASMEHAGTNMSLRFTAPLVAGSAAILKATSVIEGARAGLLAVAKDAQSAGVQFARLVGISKLPGIDFRGALRGSVALQAVGFSATGAERSLRAFSNAIALTGGGTAELDGVVRQLGQMVGHGKVLQEDWRFILSNAPAVAEASRKAFGTINPEEIEKLGLSMDQFLERLLGAMEELPHVTDNVQNALVNLGGSIQRSLGTALTGQTDGITKGINALADSVEHAGNVFRALDPTTKLVAGGLLAVLAAAGPLTYATGRLISLFAGARTALVAIPGVLGATGLAFGNFRNQVLAAQAGLNWSATAQRFQAASGVFVARSAAMSAAAVGMSRTLAASRVVLGGIAGFILSPAGIVAAITIAAAAFAHWRLKVAEAKAAADEFSTSLLGMTRIQLQNERATLEFQMGQAQDLLDRLPPTQQRVVSMGTGGRGRVINAPNPDFTKAETALAGLQTKLRSVRDAMDQLSEFDTGDLLNNLPAGPAAAGEAFKELNGEVSALVDQYGSLRELQRDYTSVLPDLVAKEAQINGLLAARSKLTNEWMAKLLGLAVKVRDVWKDIFAGVTPNVVAPALPTPRDPRTTPVPDLTPVQVVAPVQPVPDLRMRLQAGLDLARQGKLKDAADAIGFGPLALAAAALTPVFQGLKKALGPALEAVAKPLEIVGELLGGVLAPVLKLLEPPLTAFAKATSYVVEGLGYLIYAIAHAADKLIPFGNPLRGIEKFGQDMISGAKNARSALDHMADSADDMATSVDRVTEALSNIPEIFDLRGRIWQAALAPMGGGSVPTTATPPTGGGTFPGRRPPTPDEPSAVRPRPSEGRGTSINVVINHPPAGMDVTRTVRQVQDGLVQALRAPGSNPLKLAVAGAARTGG